MNDIALQDEALQLQELIESFKLKPEELELFLKMLDEDEDGKSPTLQYLYEMDYEEIPVDIDTFVEHDDYLGLIFDNGKGIYPFWRDVLRQIFDPQKGYQEIIFSGAIGIGKSSIAAICMAYILYNLLCLRRPQKYYGLPDSSYFGLAFLNMTLDTAYGIGVRKMMDLLKLSPWFLRHGKLSGKKGSETYTPNKRIDILPGSKTSHTIGRDVFAGFLDELDFAGVKNPVVARAQVMNLYTNIKRRIESRFLNGGKVPGKVFMVSSKNKATDFLESYIQENRHRKDILVIDEPIWVVKGHALRLCGETFKVAVGGRLLPSKVLTKDDNPDTMKELGYRLLDVPIEYVRSFEQNIEKSLNDIAGIATEAGFKYMVPQNVEKIMGTIKNGFTVDTIKIGLQSGHSIQDFFDPKRHPDLEYVPVYVHLDLPKTTDPTGIAITKPGSFMTSYKIDSESGTEFSYADISYDVIGTLALEALPGSEIPYYKIKEFIDWLDTYYNVVSVTADGYQSLEMTQYFTLKGKKSYVLSLDRSPEGYDNFRSAIDEERIRIPDSVRLKKELLELEQHENLKVDHPYDISGNPAGFKDRSDAIAGSCLAILKDKDISETINRNKEKAVDAVLHSIIDTDTDDDLFTF